MAVQCSAKTFLRKDWRNTQLTEGHAVHTDITLNLECQSPVGLHKSRVDSTFLMQITPKGHSMLGSKSPAFQRALHSTSLSAITDVYRPQSMEGHRDYSYTKTGKDIQRKTEQSRTSQRALHSTSLSTIVDVYRPQCKGGHYRNYSITKSEIKEGGKTSDMNVKPRGTAHQ